MPHWIKVGIDIFTALLTPAIAIFAVSIAYMQYRVAELKRKQDLFDKRYNIYELVREFILECTTPVTEYKTGGVFLKQLSISYFLCGRDIQLYLRELWQKSVYLSRCNSILIDPRNSGFSEANLEQMELLSFFREQYGSGAEEKFEKYLQIEKPKNYFRKAKNYFFSVYQNTTSVIYDYSKRR